MATPAQICNSKSFVICCGRIPRHEILSIAVLVVVK